MRYDRITRKKVTDNCRTSGVSLPQRLWDRINQDRGQTLVSQYIQQIIYEYYEHKDNLKSFQQGIDNKKSLSEQTRRMEEVEEK